MIQINKAGPTNIIIYYPDSPDRGDPTTFDFYHIMTNSTFTYTLDVDDKTERAITYEAYTFTLLPEGMYIIYVKQGADVKQVQMGYVYDGTPLTESTFTEYNPTIPADVVYVG